MKKIIITIYYLISVAVHAQWVQISTIPTTQLNAVRFFDTNTGITVGTGGVWRSTNSGANWVQALSTGRMNGLAFYDFSNGYAVGDSGKIYRTNDNGLNWIQQAIGLVTSNLNGVAFSSSLTWHVGGSNSTILRTFNASTWQYITWGNEDYYSIIMNNSGTGYGIGGLSHEFVETTANGGTNWIGALSMSGNSCYDGAMLNSSGSNVVIVGSNGRIRKSIDYGSHWTFPVSNTNDILRTITFPVVTTGYIAGDNGIILKTTDNGDTWVTQASGTNNNLRDITFINSETGWVVGDNGIVLRTGMPVIIKQLSSESPTQVRLYQNYPNPFNPVTKLKFDIVENGVTNITIFDISGKMVQSLFNQYLSAGTYEFLWNASNVASGMYFITLQNKKNYQSIKLILLK